MATWTVTTWMIYVVGPIVVAIAGWNVGVWIERKLATLSLRSEQVVLAIIFVAITLTGCWWTAEDLTGAGISLGAAVMYGSVLLGVMLMIYVVPLVRRRP